MKSLYCKVIFIPLLGMFSSLSLLAQQKQKQTPPTVSKPTVPARPAPRPASKLSPTTVKPVEKTYYAYLLITSDLDVKLSVNAERSYTIHTIDELVKVGLDPNENVIRVTPLDGGKDGYTFTQKAERPGNIVLAIDLGAKRRLALEAEEALKAEEARKVEENQKQEADRAAEEARKADERRKQEVAQAALEARYEEVYQSIGQEMVFVKGGTFQMGDVKGGINDKSVHSVTVSDFYIGKTEVTQAQWRAVMGSNPSNFKGCDQCPVEGIGWNDVQQFIKDLNAKTAKTYRLPTEAEWEYAARGGGKQTYTYAGSNTVDEVAWCGSREGEKTYPVGQKKANELGLYDMSGNLYEWCQDWYGTYPSSATKDPKGPVTGSYRVARGGSWYDCVGVAYRCNFSPDSRGKLIGFRLAR